MVVKLTGKVNGETIIFERKAGGLWVTAILPRKKRCLRCGADSS